MIKRFEVGHYAIREPYRGYPWWSGWWDVVLTVVGAAILEGGFQWLR